MKCSVTLRFLTAMLLTVAVATAWPRGVLAEKSDKVASSSSAKAKSSYASQLLRKLQRSIDRNVRRFEGLVSRALVVAKIAYKKSRRSKPSERKQTGSKALDKRASYKAASAKRPKTKEETYASIDESLSALRSKSQPSMGLGLPRGAGRIVEDSRRASLRGDGSLARDRDTAVPRGARAQSGAEPAAAFTRVSTGARDSRDRRGSGDSGRGKSRKRSLARSNIAFASPSDENSLASTLAGASAARRSGSTKTRLPVVGSKKAAREERLFGSIVRRGQRRLQGCFDYAAKGSPGLRVRLDTNIFWDAEGIVTRTKIRGPNTAGLLHGCVRRQIATWDFSQFGRRGSTELPLVFTAQ